MKSNNIMTEGLLDSILKSIIPKSIQDKATKSYLQKQEKKIKDLKNKRNKITSDLEDVVNDLSKELHKRFPDKFDKKGKLIKSKIK